MSRYARCEIERRFLVERLPPGLAAFDRLEDLYVAGTHLRLRRVSRPDGSVVVKLGQKLPDEDPRRRWMTTMYLSAGEAAVLDRLPGLRTRKRRYRLEEQGRTFSVDVWEAPVSVMLAEVEAATLEELAQVVLPSWALREVTSDPAFTGNSLAGR